MSAYVLSSVIPVQAELGEGPLWHPAERALYFVDIKGRQIHRCDADGQNRVSWSVAQEIGFLQPTRKGDFVAGLEDGIYRFDQRDGSFTPVRIIEEHLPENRLNDACVDSQGRLWFGSMDNQEISSTGALYCRFTDGELQLKEGDISITNGPALSPDGRTFYHTDTLKRTVFAYDLSVDGVLSRKRPLIHFNNGYPDGTTVDALGRLWIGLFGGWRMEQYTPLGERIASIAFPCANVTKLAFGGDDLRTAFVTTAWKGLSPSERLAQPEAGNVFSFRTDTPGLPQQLVNMGELP